MSNPSLTLAFVMDPIERVNVQTDTTFAFMLAAQNRGHQIFYVPPHAIDLVGNDVALHARRVSLTAEAASHVHFTGDQRLWARDCHAIFVRTDPPFDTAYLTATWLLSFAEAQGSFIINSPRGIRNANEKLYALEFLDLCPPTIVTASRAQALAFVAAQGGEAIIKPLNGHGGAGVMRLRHNDSNVNPIIDHLTLEGRRPVIVQRFLPEVTHGDRRLLVIDGELGGVVRRVPPPGEHRGNVHVGARAEPCEILPSDYAIARRLAPRLRRDGLLFVGLDVIGDKLIEVNVTSPTLVQELRRLGGPDLATALIETVEAVAPRRTKANSPGRKAATPTRAHKKPRPRPRR